MCQPLGHPEYLVGCPPARGILGDGQAKSAGVAPCGAVSECVRTNAQTEAGNDAPCLGRPWAAWRDRVQDGNCWRIASEGEQLLGSWDGLQIENLGPARDDNQIGDAGGLEGRRFRPGWCVDHRQVDTLHGSRIKGVSKTRRLHIGYHGGRLLTSIPPATRARLRVGVQYDDSLPGGIRRDCEREGKTCLAGAAFLRKHGYDLHGWYTVRLVYMSTRFKLGL